MDTKTDYELRVLVACHQWYKNNGDEKSTNELWFAVGQMCERERRDLITKHGNDVLGMSVGGTS